MSRFAPLLLLAAAAWLPACTFGDPPPAPTASATADAPTLEAACRREAERVVLFRDRGQQMRIDEGESRIGQQTSIPSIRAQTDAYGRSFERDRLARDCVRQSATPTPQNPPPAAAPAPPARRAR